MKYGNSNKPIKCIMKNSTCYKGTGKSTPVVVLWHSTGAKNTSISRYVQPYETDSNYNKMIALLGKNKNKNDWNHIVVKAGVNAWIGKLADGTVATVQSLPWDYAPWGCGSGKYGSCNGKVGGKHWIQLECCEDALTDTTYFNKIYKEACELTAYLCDMYGLDPNGSVKINGVKIPVILCHADSYKLGFGSNHSDVLHWFEKHGKTMEDVRKDVSSLMNNKQGVATASFKPYKVKVTSSALNVRKGAGTKYGVNGVIKDKGVYTIVDEAMNGSTKWGLLKSYSKNRNGWISLKYTQKI